VILNDNKYLSFINWLLKLENFNGIFFDWDIYIFLLLFYVLPIQVFRGQADQNSLLLFIRTFRVILRNFYFFLLHELSS